MKLLNDSISLEKIFLGACSIMPALTNLKQEEAIEHSVEVAKKIWQEVLRKSHED